ncbi:hypothetical protein PR048_026316 [Dryococelus australis]|uniref:Uncharacterized protein n=1 Tax=Dryococelus australis TaxID=614101 RepID=A0ABQ9GL01_9NEOP|nr:hypothetical protein PR048_026316 [Dryococelus australis]
MCLRIAIPLVTDIYKAANILLWNTDLSAAGCPTVPCRFRVRGKNTEGRLIGAKSDRVSPGGRGKTCCAVTFLQSTTLETDVIILLASSIADLTYYAVIIVKSEFWRQTENYKHVTRKLRHKGTVRSSIPYATVGIMLESMAGVSRSRNPLKRRIICVDWSSDCDENGDDNVANRTHSSPDTRECENNAGLIETVKDSEFLDTIEELCRRSEAMRDMLKENIAKAKEGLEIVHTIALDLQQAMPTPKLNCAAWMLEHMFIWDEIVSKRGSGEIAGCLLRYIRSIEIMAEKLIFFPVSCGGKNKKITTLLAFTTILSLQVSTEIEHYYLIMGYTCLPSDRDFAMIEKCQKYQPYVYTPDQWRNARGPALRERGLNHFDPPLTPGDLLCRRTDD